VLSEECPRTGYGCTVATMYYEYIVDGKKYGQAFAKPVILPGSGERSVGWEGSATRALWFLEALLACLANFCKDVTAEYSH